MTQERLFGGKPENLVKKIGDLSVQEGKLGIKEPSIPPHPEIKKTLRMIAIEKRYGESIEEILQRLYWQEGKLQREVGKEIGVSEQAAFKWMRDLGVRTRSGKERWQIPEYRKGVSEEVSRVLRQRGLKRLNEVFGENPKETLMAMYEEEGSIAGIAKKIPFPGSTLRRWIAYFFGVTDLRKVAAREVIKKALENGTFDQLSERERRILTLHLDTPSYTLEQIGQEFGVTRERIRRIEKRALEKLRTSPEEEKLGRLLLGKSLPRMIDYVGKLKQLNQEEKRPFFKFLEEMTSNRNRIVLQFGTRIYKEHMEKLGQEDFRRPPAVNISPLSSPDIQLVLFADTMFKPTNEMEKKAKKAGYAAQEEGPQVVIYFLDDIGKEADNIPKLTASLLLVSYMTMAFLERKYSERYATEGLSLVRKYIDGLGKNQQAQLVPTTIEIGGNFAK